jgi:hypothetical protein
MRTVFPKNRGFAILRFLCRPPLTSRLPERTKGLYRFRFGLRVAAMLPPQGNMGQGNMLFLNMAVFKPVLGAASQFEVDR